MTAGDIFVMKSLQFRRMTRRARRFIEYPVMSLITVERPLRKSPPERRMEMSATPAQEVYEVRPRRDGNGFDLISDRLRYGPIWYAGSDAVRYAVAYAKYRALSRSHRAVIRVFNEGGNVIETHEHNGDASQRNGGTRAPNIPSKTYWRPEKKITPAASVTTPANALRQRAIP
jgi:hypothetical protein